MECALDRAKQVGTSVTAPTKLHYPFTRNPPKRHHRPTRNPPKRNRRGGAYVPARTSAQRHFHAKIHALCAGDERRMRPCRATRAGTQAPPLPIPIIFFHATPHTQNNHLRTIHPNGIKHPHAILPNEINHPNETRKQLTPQQSGAEMHRALPPPQL